jgi:hypothetical protein
MARGTGLALVGGWLALAGAGAVAVAAMAGPLAAQDSVACKGPGGPTRFLASGLSSWHTGPSGVARMNLVGHDHPLPTEVVAYRERYPATYLSDSTKATVHHNVGTAYIQVMQGTLVVGKGADVDFTKAVAYGPRSFVVIAAGEPYYVWSRGPMEIQVEGVGPPRPGPIPRQGGRDVSQDPTFAPQTSATAPADSPPAPAEGLAAWEATPNGGGRMHLFGSTPPSRTELTASRYYWLPPTLQDSSKLIYHFHYGTELITVLCGTVVFGEGNHVDYAKSKDYGPGSFIENTAGNPHFEWFRGPLEVQVDFIGSGEAVPLDPVTGQPK